MSVAFGAAVIELKTQRDAALDRVVKLAAELACVKAENVELKKQLTARQDKVEW